MEKITVTNALSELNITQLELMAKALELIPAELLSTTSGLDLLILVQAFILHHRDPGDAELLEILQSLENASLET